MNRVILSGFFALCGLAAGLTSLPAQTAEHAKGRAIALIGDSTVCDYPLKSYLRGWGQMLPEFLPAGTTVLNEAKSGMSTKTFPAENWQRVLDAKPDFVLIQFGHNDSHGKARPESTDAATDYRENLRRYISEARAAGIRPILVTPPHRRTFKEGRLVSNLGPYVKAMKIVAEETNTPLIDLYASTGELFTRLGEEGSDAITLNHLGRRPGQAADRTHFTETGARELAGLVAPELRPLMGLTSADATTAKSSK